MVGRGRFPSPAHRPSAGAGARSSACGRAAESESGIRVRNPSQESGSGIRVRNPSQESEFGAVRRRPAGRRSPRPFRSGPARAARVRVRAVSDGPSFLTRIPDSDSWLGCPSPFMVSHPALRGRAAGWGDEPAGRRPRREFSRSMARIWGATEDGARVCRPPAAARRVGGRAGGGFLRGGFVD